MSRSSEGQRKFVAQSVRDIRIFGYLAITVCFVPIVAKASHEAWRVALVALMATFPAFLALRSFRSASAIVGTDDVVICGLTRTRKVPLAQIRNSGMTTKSSIYGTVFQVPYFELADGTVIVADDLHDTSEPSVAKNVVDEVCRRVGITPRDRVGRE